MRNKKETIYPRPPDTPPKSLSIYIYIYITIFSLTRYFHKFNNNIITGTFRNTTDPKNPYEIAQLLICLLSSNGVTKTAVIVYIKFKRLPQAQFLIAETSFF